MKFFAPPYTNENINKQFKILCKKLHPDRGGNNEDFIQMQIEKNALLEMLKKYSISIPKKKYKAKKIKKVRTSINFEIRNNRIFFTINKF